ncbi:MAG: hypothetical protein MUC93_09685 [Bacteroidales bacterium]|jgi:hypothetical protein|nr:hypothetical protein [Bacteroidales bacterium]
MDFNTTVDLIIKDLNEARNIIDDLKNYPGVPSFQVELAKSKCKSASELIALLKNLQDAKTEETWKESHVHPHKEISVISPSEEIQHETKPKSEAVSPSSGISEQPSKKVPESAIFADTFNHLPDSLNEKLGNLRDEDDVSDILKTKKLTNLTEAIGVNDKFLFIRELFNGNPESYNKAISSLEEVKTLDDAKAVIMSFIGDNKETDAVRQLLNLVKRKFPGNE